jgi:hypothetical protein
MIKKHQKEKKIEVAGNTLNWELRAFDGVRFRRCLVVFCFSSIFFFFFFLHINYIDGFLLCLRKTKTNQKCLLADHEEFSYLQMIERISQKYVYEQEAKRLLEREARTPIRDMAFLNAAPFLASFAEAEAALGLLDSTCSDERSIVCC